MCSFNPAGVRVIILYGIKILWNAGVNRENESVFHLISEREQADPFPIAKLRIIFFLSRVKNRLILHD